MSDLTFECTQPGAEKQGEDDRRLAADDQASGLRPGDACPKCYTGRLRYDGLQNLFCPACGYLPESVGCST